MTSKDKIYIVVLGDWLLRSTVAGLMAAFFTHSAGSAFAAFGIFFFAYLMAWGRVIGAAVCDELEWR